MRCSVRTKSGGGTERRRTGDQFLIPIDGEGREEGGNGEQRGGRAGGGPPLRRTPAGVEALGDRRATNLEPADIKPRPIPEHRSHVRRHLWGRGGKQGRGGARCPQRPAQRRPRRPPGPAPRRAGPDGAGRGRPGAAGTAAAAAPQRSALLLAQPWAALPEGKFLGYLRDLGGKK